MSTRAIQALRGSRQQQQQRHVHPHHGTIHESDNNDDDDDDNEEDDSEDSKLFIPQRNNKSVFINAAAFDDDDDDDTEEEEEDDENVKHLTSSVDNGKEGDDGKKDKNEICKNLENTTNVVDKEEEDDNIDAILMEFQTQHNHNNDNNKNDHNEMSTIDGLSETTTLSLQLSHLLLHGLDIRNLDYDYAMRTSLLSNISEPDSSVSTNRKKQSNTSSNTSYLFGPPRDGWVRPPHYVSGGLGMKRYDDEDCFRNNNNNNNNDNTTTSTNNTTSASFNESYKHIPWQYKYKNETSSSATDPVLILDPLESINEQENQQQKETQIQIQQQQDDKEEETTKYWYTFVMSDIYERDWNDYKVYIEQSFGTADINTILLFILHHPFCCKALYQLSTILYQINHTSSEGLAFLYRSLYIYESAIPIAWKQQLIRSTTTTTTIAAGMSIPNTTTTTNTPFPFYIDYNKNEINQCFFMTLQKLIQISSIAGLSQTSYTTCRFVLSLNPMCDPMNVWLIVDRMVLSLSDNVHDDDNSSTTASNKKHTEALEWLVRVAECNLNVIMYQADDNYQQHNNNNNNPLMYQCTVLDLPNWSYSYPLVLFRLYVQSDCSNDSLLNRSNQALQNTIERYPWIVSQILQQLQIDTSYGRSMVRDWKTSIEWGNAYKQQLERYWSTMASTSTSSTTTTQTTKSIDTITLSATMQTVEHIAKNYVHYCSKFWNHETVLQWLYDNYTIVVQKNQYQDSTCTIVLPNPPSPALIRYLGCNLSLYDDHIPMLPPDVAILDPNLLATAMTMNHHHRHNNNPNFRGRFVRYMNGGGNNNNHNNNRRRPRGGGRGHDHDDEDDEEGGDGHRANHNQQHTTMTLFGPPTERIDPDWPVLEIFWRSFLPWTYVQGIRPPAPP